MGWGRCSCKLCIFGNKNQFASAARISPEQVSEVIKLENEFECTINRKCGLQTLIDSGEIYSAITEELAALATSYNYNQSIIIPDMEPWILPVGAFGENCGAY
jgi:hypothetical protein